MTGKDQRAQTASNEKTQEVSSFDLFDLVLTVEHVPAHLSAPDTSEDGLPPTVGSLTVRLKSHEEAQKWFADRGITISEWALARQFNPALVYQVLAGSRKAVRGTSFKIAVALGLKTTPSDDTVGTA